MKKTRVSWVDHQRVLVETPYGNDFLIGFHSDSNFRIERQSVFKVSQDLSSLFDEFYKGEDDASKLIFGDINRALIHLLYEPVFFFQAYNRTQKDEERLRIGKRIKEMRLEKDFDAKTLAAVAGIDAANLCRIESGKYSVGFDILSKIANACGKKIDFVDLGENDYECSINVCPVQGQ